jgi:hypothetical protein
LGARVPGRKQAEETSGRQRCCRGDGGKPMCWKQWRPLEPFGGDSTAKLGLNHGN